MNGSLESGRLDSGGTAGPRSPPHRPVLHALPPSKAQVFTDHGPRATFSPTSLAGSNRSNYPHATGRGGPSGDLVDGMRGIYQDGCPRRQRMLDRRSPRASVDRNLERHQDRCIPTCSQNDNTRCALVTPAPASTPAAISYCPVGRLFAAPKAMSLYGAPAQGRRIYRGIRCHPQDRRQHALAPGDMSTCRCGNYDGAVNETFQSPGRPQGFDYPALWHNACASISTGRVASG
jgi:hypothetical protein